MYHGLRIAGRGAAAIIRRSSGRHDPQFEPALSRAPIASVEHAPSAIACSMARDFTPKHAQIVGLASKLAVAVRPDKEKAARCCVEPVRAPCLGKTLLHGGMSPSRPKKRTASSLSRKISAARKMPLRGIFVGCHFGAPRLAGKSFATKPRKAALVANRAAKPPSMAFHAKTVSPVSGLRLRSENKAVRGERIQEPAPLERPWNPVVPNEGSVKVWTSAPTRARPAVSSFQWIGDEDPAPDLCRGDVDTKHGTSMRRGDPGEPVFGEAELRCIVRIYLDKGIGHMACEFRR